MNDQLSKIQQNVFFFFFLDEDSLSLHCSQTKMLEAVQVHNEIYC